MAKFEHPKPCPKCGTPCWSTKALKFHTCVPPKPRSSAGNGQVHTN